MPAGEPEEPPWFSVDAPDSAAIPLPNETDDGYFDGIFAIIMITGEMPAALGIYMPENTADSGDSFYEIPRAAARALIDEISGLDGVLINIADEAGTKAWVYYTPGE